MHAPKLVQHMRNNAASMSQELVKKIREADRCRGLVSRVSDDEQKQSALAVYLDLLDWMAVEIDSTIEGRYLALGIHRANQGVPFSSLFWAICLAREHLWDRIEHECLVEEPAALWGGVTMLRSLGQFFDRIVYFTLLGYQRSAENELAAESYLAGRKSA
jgi:hypothetical protein